MQAAVAGSAYVMPSPIDWSRGVPARLLACITQLSQLAMRQTRRHATRALVKGNGRLVVTKELNNSNAAGTVSGAANQQWHGHRLASAVASAAEAASVPRAAAASRPSPVATPFAALPFLGGQELLAAVGAELSLPPDDELLEPLAEVQVPVPCFAATPAVSMHTLQELEKRGSHALDSDEDTPSAGMSSASSGSSRRMAASPLEQYAKLGDVDGPPGSNERAFAESVAEAQDISHRLSTALLEWGRAYQPAPSAGDGAPGAPKAAREELRGALLKYARFMAS